nr:glutaminyl-peptide cyclotransferase-like [Ipomoea batatas]
MLAICLIALLSISLIEERVLGSSTPPLSDQLYTGEVVNEFPHDPKPLLSVRYVKEKRSKKKKHTNTLILEGLVPSAPPTIAMLLILTSEVEEHYLWVRGVEQSATKRIEGAVGFHCLNPFSFLRREDRRSESAVGLEIECYRRWILRFSFALSGRKFQSVGMA